jgi:intracellular multiplication protein IcmN
VRRRLRVGTFVVRSTCYSTLLGFLLLLGCGKWVYYPNDRLRLPWKLDSAEDKATVQLQRSLSNCGVAVVTIGQDYLISISSALLFANHSPRLTWEAYGILDQVVLFLRQYRKVAVNVTSYTGKCISPKREYALTLARARAVADYLGSQCIDSRFIFTDGRGAEKPISSDPKYGDKTPNSRIEITFRNEIV